MRLLLAAAGGCDSTQYERLESAALNCLDRSGLRSIDLVALPTSTMQREFVCSLTQCTDLFSRAKAANKTALVGCNGTDDATVSLTNSTLGYLQSYVCPTATSTSSPSASPGNASTANVLHLLLAGLGGMVFAVLLFAVSWAYLVTKKKRAAQSDIAMMKTPARSFMGIRISEAQGSGPWSDPAITAMRIPLESIAIDRVVSQGGFGEVLRGTYKGEPVAVKRLLPVRRKEMNNIRTFFDEVKLTASLDHAHIVRFIGVAWGSLSDLSMVTEFLAGGDLRNLLNEHAANGHASGYDSEKLQIAVQVAHALTYLHSLQPVVVHRDLKSRNILLSEHGDAKLIDFGVSCERQDLTMTAGVGSSLWMSPEVMLGERYNEKADVFSFAVVLSELDTHELPYAHAKETNSDRKMPEMAVLQLVAQGKLTARFSNLANPGVVDLARKCLSRDPTERPTSAQVLYELHKIWQGIPVVL